MREDLFEYKNLEKFEKTITLTSKVISGNTYLKYDLAQEARIKLFQSLKEDHVQSLPENELIFYATKVIKNSMYSTYKKESRFFEDSYYSTIEYEHSVSALCAKLNSKLPFEACEYVYLISVEAEKALRKKDFKVFSLQINPPTEFLELVRRERVVSLLTQKHFERVNKKMPRNYLNFSSYRYKKSLDNIFEFLNKY